VSGDILPLAIGYVAYSTIMFVLVTVFSTSCYYDANDLSEFDVTSIFSIV